MSENEILEQEQIFRKEALKKYFERQESSDLQKALEMGNGALNLFGPEPGELGEKEKYLYQEMEEVVKQILEERGGK